MASNSISVVGSDLMYGTYKLWHTGNLTPTWEQVQNKPIQYGGQLQFKISSTSGSQNITTAQFTEWLTTNGYIKENSMLVVRATWDYARNDIISDGPNGEKINLAGSVVEIFAATTTNYTIRITTPTIQNPNNGTAKRVFVYINNGPTYFPGWYSVLTTEQGNAKYLPLSGGSMSGTIIIDTNANVNSYIGNSTRPGGELIQWKSGKTVLGSVDTKTTSPLVLRSPNVPIYSKNGQTDYVLYTAENALAEIQKLTFSALKFASGATLTFAANNTKLTHSVESNIENINFFAENEKVMSINKTNIVITKDITASGSGIGLNNINDVLFLSDIRLKTNIRPVEFTKNEINQILDLEPKRYTKSGKDEIGYIAQEVQKSNSKNLRRTVFENDEYLSLSYREIHILKEEALKQKVRNLEKRVEILTKQVKHLMSQR